MSNLTWGDIVRVRIGTDPSKRPGAIAEIVGIRKIESEDQASEYKAAIGSILYLIEFGDGSSIEIPAIWIEEVCASGKTKES